MSKYYSEKQFWKQAEKDVDEMEEAIDLLKRANEEMLEAIDLLNDDAYGELDPMPVVDFGSELTALEENREHFVDYVSQRGGIHSLVEAVDEQFLKAVSQAYEAMSLLDIRNYKVKNTLGATRVIVNEGNFEPNMSHEKTLERMYQKVEKVEINIDDILYMSNIDGLRAQYDAYEAEHMLDKSVNPTVIEKLKNTYYSMAVGTSFEHEAYASGFMKGLATTLDFIPLIGGVKQILEGIAGVTLTGDRLTGEQALQHGFFGLVGLGIDLLTFGSGSIAKSLGKFVVETSFRVGIGWSMKTATELMIRNGWDPGFVFASNVVGIFVSSQAMKAAMNSTLFHNFSVTQDMKILQRQNPELFDKVGKLLGTDARGTIDVMKGIGPEGYRQFLRDLPNIDDFLGQASVSVGVVKGTENVLDFRNMSQEEFFHYLDDNRISLEDLSKIHGWERVPDLAVYAKYKEVYDNSKFINQSNGEIKWPGQYGDINTDGFLNGAFENTNLKPGQFIDRYGSNYGTFFADIEASIPERAMAPGSNFDAYHQYEILREIPVKEGVIAPWFNQPGGGVQYMLDRDFVKEIMKKLNPGEPLIDGLIRMEYLGRI